MSLQYEAYTYIGIHLLFTMPAVKGILVAYVFKFVAFQFVLKMFKYACSSLI